MTTIRCGAARRRLSAFRQRAASSGWPLALLISTLPAAAAAHLPAEIAAQRGHAVCPLAGRDAQAVLIDQPAQWPATLSASESQALGRPVDWRHERVLVVALAQQPTAGIRVALAPEVPHQSREALSVRLLVTRPGADEMAAMVLTRPCVVAAIPRGGWRAVRVQTESGSLEAQAAKPGGRAVSAAAPGDPASAAPAAAAGAASAPAGVIERIAPPAPLR